MNTQIDIEYCVDNTITFNMYKAQYEGIYKDWQMTSAVPEALPRAH